MQIRNHVEINFHDQDLASVFLETSGAQDEQFGEVLLFTAFAARQMANLGVGPITISLATLLTQIPGHLPEMALHDPEGGPRLVVYQGAKGRKAFSADLDAADAGVKFWVHLHGFGLLGRGVGYYAPSSVVLLARYLAKRRSGDAQFIRWLETAAAMCGQAALDGRLSVPGQIEIALECAIVSRVAADSPEAYDLDKEGHAVTYELSEDLLATLRSAGACITREDLLDLFEEGGNTIVFEKLDHATQSVFHAVAEQQAAIFSERFPAAVPNDRRVLLREVGKGVFDGYILVRRLLGTHRNGGAPLQPKHAEEERAEQISLIQRGVRPGLAIESAGEVVSGFLSDWAGYYSSEGMYAQADDSDEAATLLFVTMMNGVALALAEVMLT